MPETDIYSFWFPLPGTDTSEYPLKDMERFNAIEAQLFELYSIFGNGVWIEESEIISDEEDYLSGWSILNTVDVSSGNPRVYISPGRGHVNYKYAQTFSNSTIDLVIPHGIDLFEDGLQYFLYGVETETTHYDGSIDFIPFTSIKDNSDYIYLGSFILKINSNGNYVITSIDYTNRDEISIFNSLSKLINKHVHTGGTNPPKINLRLHTAGLLPGEFIESSLSAEQITSGKLSLDRLPAIPHSELSNIGNLTHSQIDTLLSTLQYDQYGYLSDITTSNWLKMIIALKSLYFAIDKLLLNTFVYIPGKTSLNYVDEINTTATIDSTENVIRGVLADPSSSDYITWGGENAFNAVVNSPEEFNVKRSNNVIVNNHGDIELSTPLRFQAIHSKESNVQWETPDPEAEVTTPTPGSKIPVEGRITFYTLQRFKSSDNKNISQDWSKRNKLQFGIKMIDPNIIEHGDIKFHLIGSSHETLPDKTLSYNQGAISIDVSGGVPILSSEEQTAEEYEEIKTVTIDLLQFPNRNNIQGFVFSVSSITGWKLDSYEFTLHQIPYSKMSTAIKNKLMVEDPFSHGEEGNITMYVYNDLYRESRGYVIFRMLQSTRIQWDEAHWGAYIPSVTSEILPPTVDVKTRTSESKELMSYIPWDTLSEGTNEINSDSNKCIDIMVSLNASSDGRYSPSLSYLSLYYTMSSDDNIKLWDTYDQLANAFLKQNIDVKDNPVEIVLSNSDLVNSMFFIEGDLLNIIDENKMTMIDKIIDGSSLYTPPRQSFLKQESSLRNPKHFSILDNGNYLIADTDNDRIVEINQKGELHRAIQGNIYLPEDQRDFVLLSAIYNERMGRIYIAFSQNISTDIDKTKFSLSTIDGTNSFVFESDNDGIFTIVPNINGESAVIMITIGNHRKQQVDSWSSPKVLTISSGGVTGKPGESSVEHPWEPEVEMMSTNANAVNPLKLYDSNLGTLQSTEFETIDDNDDESSVFDYNKDGEIDSVNLIDADENNLFASIIVDDADVVYANILHPVFTQKNGDNNYIIAQSYDESIINIDIDSNIIWRITSDLISYDAQRGGTAFITNNNTLICASSLANKIVEISPLTKSIIFNHNTMYSPRYAIKMNNGNIVIVESDDVESGLNSRVYEIDSNQIVIREWGVGRLQDPTGVNVLNDNWLISC